MPTSPLKRSSAGGRFLASLRAPLPLQTGFPTSLADLIVNHRARFRNPARRRHRPSAAPPSSADQRKRAVVTVRDAAVRPKGAAFFSVRPELLLPVGGAVALALLVIWGKWLVASVTVASVALLWVESVGSSSSAPRRRSRSETVSCGRGESLRVSPIREEVPSEAGSPRSMNCADSDRGSDVSSLCVCAAVDDSIAPRRKEKRRSLRKLIAQKLRNGKRSEETDTTTGSPHGPVMKTEPPLPADPAVDTTPSDATTDTRCAFPSATLVPIILVGLVAGKLPAVALTVLCAVFFSSVERVPATNTC